MRFANREDAGRRLGVLLRSQGGAATLVLGIPRGGAIVAAPVARALGARLGVVVARKLGAPGQAELAMGAVTSDGTRYIEERTMRSLAIPAAYLDAETDRQVEEAARRERIFSPGSPGRLDGEVVVIVDDGVATGATAIAAARSARARGARHVTLAFPVGPPETVARLQQEADAVVCLAVEPDFWATGQFYDDFSPVDDAAVRRALDSAAPVGFSVVAGQTEGEAPREEPTMASVRPPRVGTYELLQDFESPEATVRVFRMQSTGDAVHAHVHTKSAQVYVAIEGRLVVVVDGVERVIEPFGTVSVPAGTTHGARPGGTSAVVMNISVPPLAADDQVAVPQSP